MARLVDCCPSDEEDLPNIQVGAQQSTVLRMEDEVTETKAPPMRKDLVPKTPSLPSARKFRRLGGGASNNTLFQPFTPGDSRSTRRSPTKGNMSTFSNMSKMGMSVLSFDDSDSNLRLGTKPGRIMRSKLEPELEEQDEEDGLENSSTTYSRIHELQTTARKSTPDIGESSLSSLPEDSMESLPTQPSIQITEEYNEDEEAADIARQLEDTFMSSNISSIPAEASSLSGSTEFSEVTEDSGSDYSLHHTPEKHQITQKATKKSLFDLSPVLEQESSSPHRRIVPVLQPRELNTLRSPFKRDMLKPKKASDLSDSLSVLGESLSKLRIDLEETAASEEHDDPSTPPMSPSGKSKKSLSSPSKLVKIPATPHRQNSDAFWDQEQNNNWNDQHSPRKLILPPVEKSPTKKRTKEDAEARKAFDTAKHTIAESFLRELDEKITDGKIFELAEPTGGIRIVWSKTLNTTAGRANWRRESIKTIPEDGSTPTVTYKHHASIELAEKVIDDENRLLNVIAHEFCHLANFMINNMTTNPHGKEFKAWATKVTRAFSNRGITVTTKHSYEIEFKYIWTCTSCDAEHKRHSKSINPLKHRCGKCKGDLKQTKPVPRAKAGSGKEPSEWQIFVKEQMKVVKQENPSIKQQDVMKLVAEKWARRREENEKSQNSSVVEEVESSMVSKTDGLVAGLVDLTIGS